jgi:WD40 repeat protein
MLRIRALAFLLGAASCALGFAQQTTPPASPPINAAQARADGVAAGLPGPGTAVVYSESSGDLIAACEKGSFHIWRKDVILGVRSGDSPPSSLDAHKGQVLALAVDGGLLASGGSDAKVVIWDLSTFKTLHTLDAGGMVRTLSLAPGGKLLASAGDGGVVQLWDLATGKPGLKLSGSSDWLLAATFSPDGKTLAAGGFDGHFHIWDVATGKQLVDVLAQAPPPANTPAPPNNVVSALAYSADGKTLAVGGSDGQVYLFTAADGKFIRALSGHTSSITSLAFHPGGTVIVSASKDRSVRLWNPANGQLIKALEGHTAWVQGVVFTAQATRLASISADHTVRFWDLTEPKK